VGRGDKGGGAVDGDSDFQHNLDKNVRRQIRRWTRLVLLLLGSLLVLVSLAGGLVSWGLFLPAKQRLNLQAWGCHLWCRFVVWTLGIRLRLEGETGLKGSSRATLIVSNHLSYVDVLLIGSLSPAIFVAKHEVASWPFLGWLVRVGGTLFLTRGSTSSNVRCLYRVSSLLRRGQSVVLFPEGTTSDGSGLMTFHPFFLSAAIRSRREILPLTLRIDSIEGRQALGDLVREFCWVGDDDFIPHFWHLLTIQRIEVAVVLHPVLPVSRQDRAAVLAPMVKAVIEGPLDRDWVPPKRDSVREAAVDMEIGTREEPREVAVEFLAGALLLTLLASPQGGLLEEQWGATSGVESSQRQGGQP
jgi:1-acyl-sn-glycerol-3-phosphate acyltransferase